ncbi:MAG: tetratricopeptide repeat protein [Chthoniobacterales bacterium]
MADVRRRVTGIVALALLVLLFSGCTENVQRWYHVRRGEKFFQAQQYESAKIEYLNVLRVSRGDHAALERMGLIWSAQGAPLQAYGYLKKAAEFDPDNAEVRAKLARILLTFGDVDTAREEARAVLANSPLNDDALLIFAETVRDSDELRETQQRLEQFDDKKHASFHLARAVLARRAGDQAVVERELAEACAVEPTAPRAHLALAEFLVQRGDAARAEAEFKRAAELAPVRSEESIKCAEYLISRDETKGARELLTRLTSAAPDYVPAWTMLARAALREQNYDDALRFVGEALDRDPYGMDAHLTRSEIHVAQGDAARAVQNVEMLDRAFPGVPLIRYHLARALLQDNKPARGQEILKQVVINTPGYTDAILLLADTNTRLGQGDLAIGSLLDLLSKRPGLPEAQALLVDAYESRGYWEEASELVRKQIESAPGAPELYTRLGSLLRRGKKTDAARAALQNALRLAPGEYAALDELVATELERNDIARAQGYVDEQRRLRPDSPAVATVQAKIELAQQAPERAEAAAKGALALQADFVPAADFLASLYIAQGKLEAAVAQLQTVVAKLPRNGQALLTLAQAQDKLGRYDDARDSYEKLLAIYPDTPLAMNNLAFLYAEHFQQLDRAAELAWRARSMQRDDPGIADTLGWVLYRQGDYAQAVRMCEESAAARPEDPQTQLHLGLAHYMTGETEAAAEALQIAAKSDDATVRNESAHRLEFLRRADAPQAELESRLTQDASDVVARLRLADLQEKRGNFTAAEEQYRAALKTNPKLLPGVMKLAALEAGPLKNCDEALEIATQARALKPYDAVVAGGLGRVAYRCGNLEWASSLLGEAVRADTNDVQVLTDFAWATYSVGKAAEAAAAMEKALAAGAQEENGASGQFITMVRAEDDLTSAERVLPDAEKSLVKQSEFVPALMLQARLRAAHGEANAAMQIYSRLLDRWPAFALAQKRLAQLLLNDPTTRGKAYDLLSRARKGLPGDPEVAQLLAELSFERKDFAYAAELLNESASKRPLSAKLLYYLAVCSWETKQLYATKQNLERALNSGLAEPMAGDARRLLAQLSQ